MTSRTQLRELGLRLLRELGLRFRRVRPIRLPRPLQIFVVISWLLIGALCVFVASYFVASYVEGLDPSWQMAGLYLVASGAGFAVAGCGALSRLLYHPSHRLAGAGTVLLMSLLPLAVARAGQDRAVYVVAAGCLLAAGAVLALPNTRSAGPSSAAALGRACAVAVLILLSWMVAGLTALLESSTGQPWDDMAISAFIPALGALVLPFYDLSAIAAVTSGAMARQSRALKWLGRYSSVWIVLVLLAAKAVYIIARLKVRPDLFDYLFDDATLWKFSGRSPGSWLHASALAGAICFIAARSKTRPLSNRGWTGAVLLISLVPALPFLLDIFRFMVFVVAFAVSPTAAPELVERWLVSKRWNQQTPWLWLMAAVVVLVGVVAAWRSRRDGLSAAVVLLGLGCASMLPQILNPLLRTGSALPGQVDAVITIGVLGILVGRLVRASNEGPDDRSASNRALVRLLVVPFAVLHAVALVPAVWESHLFPVLAVLAVVIAALTLPPVSGDPARHARVLLTLLVVETMGLMTVALVEITNQPDLMGGLGDTSGFSLLVLAVPLGGTLCCRTTSLD